MSLTPRIGAGGLVSTANSTTTLLGVSGVFTGTFEEILETGHITIQVRSNVVSATDGLSIEWSSDGVTAQDTDVFTVPANKGKVYTFGPQAQYFRIKYTNGGTAQTTFNLQVIKKVVSQKASSHRIQDMIVDDDDAELIKSILAAKRDDGAYTNVTATNDNRLRVSASQESVALTDLGQVFSISVDYSLPSSGVFNPAIFIKNPIGNTKKIRIIRISLGVTIANVAVAWRLFVNPTTTANGTSQTPVNLNVGGGSNPVVTAEVYLTPTVTSNGTRLFGYESGQNVTSTEIIGDALVVLNPGNTLLITGDPLSNNRNTLITMYWTEV